VELFIEGDLLPLILRDIARSKAKIVIDHFGCPNPDKGVNSPGFTCLLDAVSAGNTWVKLSAPYRGERVDPQAYVVDLLKEIILHKPGLIPLK
jgi:predicted TIM-barrel fold metal-dependent hydrolase